MFDNRLSFQTSVYYIDWSGIQTTVNLPSCGAFFTGGPIGFAPNQAYGQLNLRLGAVHGGLDVSAFVDSVTNADPILGLTHASVTDSLYSATAIRPRTMGVTGLYRF